MSADDSKIIIDEDWKSQVQAEKEAARAKDQPAAQPAASENPSRGTMPPPTLSSLVSMLATQASLFLGAGPSPLSGQIELSLDDARHTIDMLQMLEDKTKGNTTPEEAALLKHLLSELRMAYVTVQNHLATQMNPKDS